MSEFNNSKWDATNWTTEQKARWQERCFELGYRWCCGSTEVKHLGSKYFYVEVEGNISISNNPENFCNYSEVEKHYEDMFPVEKLVHLSRDSFDGRLIIATLGEKSAEEYLNGEGIPLELPIKPEHTQLLNRVFCTQVDEVETKPRVKWVTANTSGDTLDCLMGCLTDGKDYKVVAYDGNCYYVRDDKGSIQRYHHNWFDTPETIKTPPQPEHIDTGFDGLVYLPPMKKVHIKLNTLSEEQVEWFTANIPFDNNFNIINIDTIYISYSLQDKDWYFSKTHEGNEYTLTTFNEVFKEIK